MGFVKEWEEILSHFFEDLFFEAKMLYAPDETNFATKEWEVHEKVPKGALFYSLEKSAAAEEYENAQKVRLDILKSEILKTEQMLFLKGGEEIKAAAFTRGFEEPFSTNEKRVFFENDALLENEAINLSDEKHKEEIFTRKKGFAEKVGGIRLAGGKTGEIIESLYPVKDAKCPEIKIEMVNTNNIQSTNDIDETIDLISERLCEMMAKGADGIYW